MWSLPLLLLVDFALVVVSVYVRKYPILKLVSVIFNTIFTIVLICFCFKYNKSTLEQKTLINYYKDQCIQQYDQGLQDGVSYYKQGKISTTCTITDGELVDEYYSINE